MAQRGSMLTVRVCSIKQEAEGVLRFELRPEQVEMALPAFSAGAHIEVQLPGGLARCYSLCNDPSETHRYWIAVNRDRASRGGSRWLHEALRPGDLLQISAPRNHFLLADEAPAQVFIAGGIGITPIMSMIARCMALGTPWTLHYAARTRRSAAFVEQVQRYAETSNARITLYFDQEPDGQRLDVREVVGSLPSGAHIYCCGPSAMLEPYRCATACLPQQRVHQESFTGAASAPPAPNAPGYTVTLARSGREVRVDPGQSLLDALIAAGADPMYSCREGVCGTCEIRVLAGEPDHRDHVLSSQERAANDRMMPCCSGARGGMLVLDL